MTRFSCAPMLAAVAALCAVGCGDDDDGEEIDGRPGDARVDLDAEPESDAPSPDGGSPADGFFARFAAAYCARLAPTCAGESLAYDEARCRANAEARFRQAFNYGRGRYDAEAAEACLDGLPAIVTGERSDLPAACDLVLAPTGASQPGEACRTSSDCASPPGQHARCFEWGAFEQNGVREGRACVVMLPAAQGEECNQWGAPPPPVSHTCAPGLICVPGENGSRCGPRLGGSCETFGNDACHFEDMCDPETHTCVPAPGLDQPCGRGEKCGPGLRCDFLNTFTCKPKTPNGNPCLAPEDCASGRCESGYCAATVAGLCAAPELTPRARFALDLAQARCEATATACCERASLEDEFPTCARDLAEASVPMVPLVGPFDADAAARCLAAAGELPATCPKPFDSGDPNERDIPDQPDDCARAVAGTLPADTACVQTAECALPASGMVRCDSGACRQYVVGAEDDTCGEVSPNVVVICRPVDGLYCGPGDRCVPTLPPGAECSHFAACTQPARCSFTTFTCVSPMVGMECDNDTNCVGLRCHPEQKVCVEKLAGGEHCSWDEDCASGACVDGVCLGTGVGAVGYYCEGP